MTLAAPETEVAALPEFRREAGTLARRSAFNFVGLTAASALQFVLVLLIARRLGQQEAGIFFEGFAALRLLSTVAAVGFDVTAVRYVAVHRARGDLPGARAAVRIALAVCGAVSVTATLLMLAAAPLVADALSTPELTYVLRVMILALPAVVLQMVLISATRGTGRMRAYVLVDQIWDGVARLAAIAIVLFLGLGLHGVAWACTAASVAITAAAAVAAAPIVFGESRRHAGHLAELVRFSSYQWGAVVAGVGMIWVSPLMLGIWRPASDVAVYSIATRTVLLGLVFVLPIGIAFQPMIARLYTQGDRPRLRRMYGFATKWSTLAGCPPLLFTAVFATPIIVLLYHEKYARGAWPLAILALAQTVNAATGPCGHLVTMAGRSDLVFKNSIAALALNVVLCALLIPPFGMLGAAIAWALAIVAWNLYRLLQAWQVLHMQPFEGWPARAAVALGGFVGACALWRLALSHHGAFVAVAAGVLAAAVFYGAALVALGILDLPRERPAVGDVRRLLAGLSLR